MRRCRGRPRPDAAVEARARRRAGRGARARRTCCRRCRTRSRRYATLGEVSDALRDEFGVYHPTSLTAPSSASLRAGSARCARQSVLSAPGGALRRPTELAEVLRAERVALIRVTALEARVEPLHALCRRAVRPGVLVDGAGRLSLQRVVADGGRRADRLFDVALLEVAAGEDAVAPDARRSSPPAARGAPTARWLGQGCSALLGSPCR